MARVEYETSFPEAARALSVGALMGGTLVAILSLALVFIRERAPASQVELLFSVFIVIFALIFSCLAFGIGLLVVGAPSWWLLHRLGFRGRPSAVMLGFIATFLVNLVLGAPIRMSGTYSEFEFCGAVAVIGALVGLTIWRLAYQRKQSVANDAALFFE